MAGWGNSTRRLRLPPDWPRIRARVLRRDPFCVCRGPVEGCTLHLGTACTEPSAEVDHLVPNDDHSPANLAGKCSACHLRKTIATRPRPKSARRPVEPHPGIAPLSRVGR